MNSRPMVGTVSGGRAFRSAIAASAVVVMLLSGCGQRAGSATVVSEQDATDSPAEAARSERAELGGSEGAVPTGLPETGDEPAPGAPPDTSDPEALIDPITDGWQGVRNAKRPIAYDVPDDWVALGPGALVGFEDEDPEAPFGYSPRVIMGSVAAYGQTTCGGNPTAQARVGTSGMGQVVDTAAAAEHMANEWAGAAYENDDGDDPKLERSGPTAFEANDLQGHVMAVDVRPAPDDCAPKRAHVRVASVEVASEDDVYNLIFYGATSGKDAVDMDIVDTIFSSLRLHRQ